MTETQLIRTRLMLQILEGSIGLLADAVLHAQLNLRAGESLTLAEFSLLRDHAEREQWITGVSSKFTGAKRWQISDEGRAALAQM